jgi:heme-degrading monooxygenase HmoA
MFAGVTLAEIDPVRMSIDAAVELFRQSVLPELRRQHGYAGIFVLTTPEGRTLLVSLWDTAESAQANVQSGFYETQLSKFATVFRSPPGREQYRVALIDEPANVSGANA